MNYCCNFQKHRSLENKVEEITIKYNKDNTHIVNFLNEHPNQKINVYVDSENESLFIRNKEIEKAQEYCFTIKVDENCSQLFFDTLKASNVYFFSTLYARDWEDIHYLINLGVSEIYITEALGFDLERVSKYLHQRGIKIRVFPNVAQVKRENIIPNIKAFFIRPEDLSVYEKYIDVVEMWGDKVEVFYDIYHTDKEWFGDLSEIISGLEPGLDSRFILPHFGERRIKCNRKCLSGESCSICEAVIQCSETLQKAGLLINYIKEEEQNG